MLEYSEDEPFNPDYVEVDRVLDSSEHTDQDTKVNKPVYRVVLLAFLSSGLRVIIRNSFDVIILIIPSKKGKNILLFF